MMLHLSISYLCPAECLIIHTDEVVCEILHDRRSFSRLCGRDVNRNKNGLFRLHQDAAISLDDTFQQIDTILH